MLQSINFININSANKILKKQNTNMLSCSAAVDTVSFSANGEPVKPEEAIARFIKKNGPVAYEVLKKEVEKESIFPTWQTVSLHDHVSRNYLHYFGTGKKYGLLTHVKDIQPGMFNPITLKRDKKNCSYFKFKPEVVEMVKKEELPNEVKEAIQWAKKHSIWK